MMHPNDEPQTVMIARSYQVASWVLMGAALIAVLELHLLAALLAEPTIVLEIAFDRIQESSRHKSGYAMRFPRIVRIRDDKTVDQISTIDEVRRIYEGQLKRERQE